MTNLAFEDVVDAKEQLDNCKYLFLRQLEEPVENQLRFVVEEAAAQVHLSPVISSEVPEVAALISGSSPIISDSMSRAFEISFVSYISYTVSDESYSKYPESPEVFRGNLFRRFRWSYLLEFTRRTTYASDEHPGPWPLLHFEIPCLNHVIDVITTVAPLIRMAKTLSQDVKPN